MPTPIWLTVVLIILCLLSLVGVGWCLLFMAPLEKFRKHVNSLGGGMKGIEQHLAEVGEEIHGCLAALEESSRQEIGETRENVEASLAKLAADGREFRRELKALSAEVESLRADLGTTTANGAKVAQGLEAATRQIARLRSDFDSLDLELRESVRQLVGESFSTVESTVLAALDAVQEEIVYGVSEPSDRPQRFQPRRLDSRRPPSYGRPPTRGRDNIISVGPLFAELPADGGDGQGEDDETDESSPEEQGADEQGDDGSA